MLPTSLPIYESARKAWLAERRTGIGSSDAPVIVGCDTRKSKLALYAEKVGIEDISPEETEAMEWGRRLEPVTAAKYEDDTGRSTYDPGDFHIERHSTERWMLATPDRIVNAVRESTLKVSDDLTVGPGYTLIAKPPVFDVPGVLELKTTSVFNKADWRDEPPLEFQVQLQHQLAVTGHLWGSIAVLIGGQSFLWTDIPRNEAFIDRLMEAEHEFWLRVERRQPPEPDASASAKRALFALYPEPSADHITLGANAMVWDEQRALAIESIKAAEKERDEAENHLKALIGTHAAGVLPNGAVYRWTNRKRAAHMVQETSWRQLDRSPRQGAPKR